MSRAAGIGLLLLFGVLNSSLVGACLGTLIVLILTIGSLFDDANFRFREFGGLLAYGVAAGVVAGAPAGVVFGLLSWLFVKSWHWLVGGFLCALPTVVVLFGSAPKFDSVSLFWTILSLICGVLAGVLNIVRPNWWRKRLHRKALTMLTKNL